MKYARKKGGRLARVKIYRGLSHNMLWVLFTFLGLLSYVTEARPFIYSYLGMYALGLMDGILISLLIMAIIFYLKSR